MRGEWVNRPVFEPVVEFCQPYRTRPYPMHKAFHPFRGIF